MLSIAFDMYHAAPVNTAAECREVAEMATALYALTGDVRFDCDATFFSARAMKLQSEECGAPLDGGGVCEEKGTYLWLGSGIGLCEACYHASDDRSEGSIFGEEEFV